MYTCYVFDFISSLCGHNFYANLAVLFCRFLPMYKVYRLEDCLRLTFSINTQFYMLWCFFHLLQNIVDGNSMSICIDRNIWRCAWVRIRMMSTDLQTILLWRYKVFPEEYFCSIFSWRIIRHINVHKYCKYTIFSICIQIETKHFSSDFCDWKFQPFPKMYGCHFAT